MPDKKPTKQTPPAAPAAPRWRVIDTPFPLVLSLGECESFMKFAMHTCVQCGKFVKVPVLEVPAVAMLKYVPPQRQAEVARRMQLPQFVYVYDTADGHCGQARCSVCGGQLSQLPLRYYGIQEEQLPPQQKAAVEEPAAEEPAPEEKPEEEKPK